MGSERFRYPIKAKQDAPEAGGLPSSPDRVAAPSTLWQGYGAVHHVE